ncbi:MAG: septal ring lytic transglycosylase RlpA family protein [Edaphobacter sp.]
MQTKTGNERTATLTGRTKVAVALAAMVVLSAFATDTATPASALATNPAMAVTDVSPAEIVTTMPAPKVTVLTRIKSGMASWYGSVLQGHLTASGRRFNEYELTAAHRTLPFGSKVKVTNLRNHRSVVVTITDRGVLFPERVIDLSYGAAKELGMVKMGVDPVKLELMTFRS